MEKYDCHKKTLNWVNTFFVLIVLVGCSTLIETEKNEKLPQFREITREPGSLWSSDSVWNNMYGPPKIVVGDVISIKITDRFKEEILSKLGDKKSEKSKEEKKAVDTSLIYAKIIEVKKRGIYKIHAEDIVRIGSFNPVVTIEGEIRERDIDKDDNVSSDSIIGLNLNVINQKSIF